MNTSRSLIQKWLDRPIAYHRVFVDITGSVQAAIMLSQAVYWSQRTKDADGWFYKSMTEWQEETGLTRSEQETARKQLNKTTFWESKLKGVPATLNFKINFSALFSSLHDFSNLGAQFAESQQSSLQDSRKHSTTETTTETTFPSNDGELFKKPVLDTESQLTPEKKTKKKREPKAADECYADFVKMWCEAYPDLGFDGVSGVKINSMIKRTRERMTAVGKIADKESVNAAFAFVLAYVKRENHWVHGQDIKVFDQKYLSVVREIKEGKPVKQNQVPSSAVFSRYSNMT